MEESPKDLIENSFQRNEPLLTKTIFSSRSYKSSVGNKDILLSILNECGKQTVPKLIAIPSKEIELDYPKSYSFYKLITQDKNGRKCIVGSSGRKTFGCLESECINTVSKYNYCKTCRNSSYEKNYTTRVLLNGNIAIVSLGGIHYQNTGFYISEEDIKIAKSKTWWLNPKEDVICNEGKFIDMICQKGWKAKKIASNSDLKNDLRRSNLKFAIDEPWKDAEGQWHIPLNGERGFGKEALIEEVSYEVVMKYKKWSLSPDGYAVSGKTSMHRLVRNFPKGKVVDHLNRCRTDNRLSNLMVKTAKENARNRTTNPDGYEGVKWDKDKNIWKSVYKNIDIFWNKNEKMCALCHDSVRVYVTGEIAGLNDMTQEPKDLNYWNLPSHIIIKLDELKAKQTSYHGVKYSKDGWVPEITIKLGPFPKDSEAAMVRDVLLMLFPHKNENKEFNFDKSKYTAENMKYVMSLLFSDPKP